MEITYINPWYKNGQGYGPDCYRPDRKVDSINGFDIYYRAGCFDVVQDGVCRTQMAGPSGYKDWIKSQN